MGLIDSGSFAFQCTASQHTADTSITDCVITVSLYWVFCTSDTYGCHYRTLRTDNPKDILVVVEARSQPNQSI